MQLTILGLLGLLVLINLVGPILENRSRKNQEFQYQWNQKSVTEIQADLIRQLQKEKQDLLNRLMSQDLQTYRTMTMTAQASDSTSSISNSQPISYSDEAEWAREQGFDVDNLDQRDLERLSERLLGLG